MALFGKKGAHQWRGVINEYRKWLPVTDQTPVITLGVRVAHHLFMHVFYLKC